MRRSTAPKNVSGTLMTTPISSLLPHAERLRATATLRLFADDPARLPDFSIDAAGLHLDYAKQRLDRPARERRKLLMAVCDRLAASMVAEGRGGEAHWELAEQTALVRAATEWGVGEWFFTASGQAGALTDWAHGRPVPPEMRRRWVSAWAGRGACQWTALHVVRELLRETQAGSGSPAEATAGGS
jgi:hypothetical protein